MSPELDLKLLRDYGALTLTGEITLDGCGLMLVLQSGSPLDMALIAFTLVNYAASELRDAGFTAKQIREFFESVEVPGERQEFDAAKMH